MKTQVSTENAPKATGLLSQAIISNNFIFVAGQVHINTEGRLVEGSVEDMLKQVMTNIQEILKAAGAKLDNVVKATVYVTDMKLLPELNKHYPTYFSEPLPAREAVCVKELPLGASIEISVIADLEKAFEGK